MVYNVSLVANSTSMLTFFQRVNSELMSDWFGFLIWLAIMGIVILTFMAKTNDVAQTAIGASFISLVVSFLLVSLGMMHQLFVFGSLICFGAAFFFLKKS